jgi:hypothetical protein
MPYELTDQEGAAIKPILPNLDLGGRWHSPAPP